MSPHHELLRAFLDTTAADLGHRRPQRWMDFKLGLPLAVGVALVGCGGDTAEPSPGEGDCTGDECSEECSDGIDNDADGALDCDDADCAGEAICFEGTGGTGGTGGSGGTGGIDETGGVPNLGGAAYGMPYEICGDDVDNDFDGAIDCADSDCASTSECAGTGGIGGTGGTGGLGGLYGVPYEDCSDNVDNDYDGDVDCADSDCLSSSFCSAPAYGIPMEDCSDGVDNDFDGDVDCADEDCYDNAICVGQPDYAIPMEDCSNGYDDDFDGAVDCLDSDCMTDPNCGMARYAAPM